MTIDRLTRVNQLLKQEIAESLFRVFNDPGADIGSVTVTRVVTSSNLRNTRAFISIRGDEARQHELLNLIRSHRRDIQACIAKHVVLKYTPHVTFELDHSIEQGDNVLNLIARLEDEQPETFNAEPEGSPREE